MQRIILFFAAILLLVKLLRDKDKNMVMNQVTGTTMGTIGYNIKYRTQGENDLKPQVDSLLRAFNQSLSTYIPDSEISRFNKTGEFVFEDNLFSEVLKASRQVFVATEGAFDPTIGPLVNAYGFGPDKGANELTPLQIDSLRALVDFDNIQFDQLHVTRTGNGYLDFSAVAKGYAVDLIFDYLMSKGIDDVMVEIGGEVRAKGTNNKGKTWAIGIEDPLVEIDEQELLAIVNLDDKAVATSGNYRNYYRKDGKLYAHILDPRTGKTSNQTILSASVFAPDCMQADAYATAFMVMGTEAAMKIVEANPDLDAIFIDQGNDKPIVTVTDGIEQSVTLLNDFN